MDSRRAEQIKQAREMEFREVHGCSRESHVTRQVVGSRAFYMATKRPGMSSRSSSMSSTDSVKAPSPTLYKAGDDIWR